MGRHRFWIALFVCAGLAACAAPPLREYTPSADIYLRPATPLHVQTDEMETITVGRTLVDVPEGITASKLVTDGVVQREFPLQQADLSNGLPAWTREGMNELRAAGYPVLGQESLLFGQDESSKSRYVVGGTVKDYQLVVHNSAYQTFDQYTPMEFGVDMVWQVYDTSTRQVSFTKHERGYAETAGIAPVINKGVRSSFRHLLADPDFVAAIRKRGSTESAEAPSAFPPMTLAGPAPAEVKLPEQMQSITDAVVTVRVGSVHGTAFFITHDGYLLTAAHVVAGRDTCLVKIGDGRQAEARVWRIDLADDVALLRVAEAKYPALQLNRSGRPGVGSEVYAIGTPLTEDLDRSVSRGIVSAERVSAARNAIQTDAAVNAGNSGGPLIDHNGKVVGIISQKVALPGFSGIGFAIPIDTAISKLSLQLNAVSPAPSK